MKKISHSKPFVDEKDVQAVSEQIISGEHANGEKTKEFENEFKKFIGANYAKATNSGTSALHLALLSLGIKKDDEVIIPSYVCQSLLNSVNYVKAKPILADININNFNISSKTIEPLITKNTKAIILPHMFGIPADIEEIIKLKIPVIEDCAQALGVEYKNKKLGSFGIIGIFSFYATKLISTGQGGMIATNSKKISDKINDLMTYDKKENYSVGYNYELSDILSALGISQLKKLPEVISRRKKIAEKYDREFENKFKTIRGKFPFRYLIQLEDKEQRKKLQNYLREKNIISEQPVFKPLHQYLNLNSLNFPNTEFAHNTILSIPIYPALSDEEVERIIDAILEFNKR